MFLFGFRRKSRTAVKRRQRDAQQTGGGPATVAEVGEDALAVLGAEGLRDIGTTIDSSNTCKLPGDSQIWLYFIHYSLRPNSKIVLILRLSL